MQPDAYNRFLDRHTMKAELSASRLTDSSESDPGFAGNELSSRRARAKRAFQDHSFDYSDDSSSYDGNMSRYSRTPSYVGSTISSDIRANDGRPLPQRPRQASRRSEDCSEGMARERSNSSEYRYRDGHYDDPDDDDWEWQREGSTPDRRFMPNTEAMLPYDAPPLDSRYRSGYTDWVDDSEPDSATHRRSPAHRHPRLGDSRRRFRDGDIAVHNRGEPGLCTTRSMRQTPARRRQTPPRERAERCRERSREIARSSRGDARRNSVRPKRSPVSRSVSRERLGRLRHKAKKFAKGIFGH